MNFDWQLIILTLLLCVVGLGLQYSAGFDPDSGYSPPMRKQMISMSIGWAAFIICMLISTSFWRKFSPILYLVGAAMLTAILFRGVVAGGAQRWLDIGGFRMQPSEFMKLAVVLALARVFSSESAPRDGYTLMTLFTPCVILGIPVFLIIKEPDLGTALGVILIGGSMLFLAGVRRGTSLRLSLLGLGCVVPAWMFMLKDYQKRRVLTFLSPEHDPLGSGYHAIQSKIAVGSGALTGKGFLEGTQTQLRFLPEQTTDFIFSVLAEEWGFLGSFCILCLYGLLLFRLISITARCTEPFPAYVAFGVAAIIFWHVTVNIGMVVGILPVVGLTLPLLSFGGSSVVTILAALGICAGFSIRRFMFA